LESEINFLGSLVGSFYSGWITLTSLEEPSPPLEVSIIMLIYFGLDGPALAVLLFSALVSFAGAVTLAGAVEFLRATELFATFLYSATFLRTWSTGLSLDSSFVTFLTGSGLL